MKKKTKRTPTKRKTGRKKFKKIPMRTMAFGMLVLIGLVIIVNSRLLVERVGTETTSLNPSRIDQIVGNMEYEYVNELEAEGILYMREEEKLAHDVYIGLYDKWKIQTFKNIASSEQTHTDSVKSLINKYGLTDPAEGKAVGEFTNANIQTLYGEFLARGMASESEALRAAASIEEIDIIDLRQHMAQTDNDDILFVYDNLIRGSENHLRAFSKQMERRGIEYESMYLGEEEYERIIG